MDSFVYTGSPSRVVFGKGTINQLPEEVAGLEISRAMVLSTPGHQKLGARACSILGEVAGGLYPEAVMHTPVSVTEDAMQFLAARQVDGLVAVGGGSTIGLGKAIALRTGLPLLAVPTTYAGSEMTSSVGQTANGQKTVLRDPRVLPKTVIYDVALTFGLPSALSVASGLNAIAHAAEALYAPDRNPIVEIMAREAIVALTEACARLPEDPSDFHARSRALYGAWLGGACLGATTMALHHKLCHVLGGMFDLPHAQTHAVILPYVMEYNAEASPSALGNLLGALGDSTGAPSRLQALARNGNLPGSLQALGMPPEGVNAVAELVASATFFNPAPITLAGVKDVLEKAYRGVPI